MKLTYISHSSFLVECGSTRLLFDPWIKGSAYFNQWFLWPPADEKAAETNLDAILISHGHEDHLHGNSLKTLDKNASVFFPYQWREGITSYLNHLGFSKVQEAVSFRTYLVNDVKVTYLSYSLESVIVLEYKDTVVVNINDALNSNHENAVNFLLKEIKKRWPRITYLLSGWSGAGHFPNQIKYPGKNDFEVGKLREQFFANNFCRFVHFLKPEYAVPFAPGFVLLKAENQWINEVKFPRNNIEEYYRKHFEENTGISFLIPYPSDTIDGGLVKVCSPLHEVKEEDQYKLAYKHYYKEIPQQETIKRSDPSAVSKLKEQLEDWINYNRVLYAQEVLMDAVFSIQMEDLQEETYFNILPREHYFEITVLDKPLPERKVLIKSTSDKLLFALKKTWGGDVLTIGYGLTIEVYDELSLEKNLDIVCVRLITRYPIARKDLLKNPFRALKFYTQNPLLTSLWLKQKIVLKPYVNKFPFNERDHWLTYNKCDLCAVCKMPQL